MLANRAWWKATFPQCHLPTHRQHFSLTAFLPAVTWSICHRLAFAEGEHVGGDFSTNLWLISPPAVARNSGHWSSNWTGRVARSSKANQSSLFFVMRQCSTFPTKFNLVAHAAVYRPEKAATVYFWNEHGRVGSDLFIIPSGTLGTDKALRWPCTVF